MVKLATAREARMYGPALAVRRWEYINAGAYAFAALLLAAALAAVTAGGGAYSSSRAALAVAAVALSLVAAVNAHDLAAHVAGVDCRVGLARYDFQLGLVELLAPALHAAGCIVGVVGIALLLSHSQGEGAGRHAANALLAAALLWLLGSVLNSSQVYERADARAQLLQSSVHLPLLLGSLLFLVAAVLNRRRVLDLGREPVLVGRSWAWLSLAGSLLWLMAAACNMVKVKMMHQSDALRLEKLRCGAQERLSRDREGRVPLVWEDQAARRSALPAELR